MPDDNVAYPGDYAIWAFKLCAQAWATFPKAEETLESGDTEPTGRRAAIEAQKARK